jgi:hypothetical protein
MKSSLIVFLLFTLIVSFKCSEHKEQNITEDGFEPKDGFVPNEETAIKIAEAIWLPIYGDKINNNKPFKATLKDSIWVIEGTLYSNKGGVPYLNLRKSDCKILKVIHTK